MKYPEPFSILRQASIRASPYDRLRGCFAHARSYVESTSLEHVLAFALEHPENRESVAALVSDALHVGFLFPQQELTPECLSRAANEVGLCVGHATFPSAVVARELGLLASLPQVPTTVFSSAVPPKNDNGRRRYVEAFLPSAASDQVQSWIDQEIATHVGLTLGSPAALASVQEVFWGEGYKIPEFMGGESVVNPGKGVSVTYFEKKVGARSFRIEFMAFVPRREG